MHKNNKSTNKSMSCKLFVMIMGIIIFSFYCLTLIFPPNSKTVEKHFLENYNDIVVIVEFLVNSNYDSIYIHNSSGNISSGTNKIQISEKEVLVSLKNLLDNNQYSIIIKKGNTIFFQQRTRFFDAGSGIAYSINGIDLPNIAYMNQCVPLDKDNWYFYTTEHE